MRILPLLVALLPFAASAGTLTTLATVPAIADSGFPQSSLVPFEGKLYGTTRGYGDPGTVFSISPTTGKKTTIYTFTNGADGGFPVSALTLFQGKLYGSTSQYGANKAGTIFEVDPSTGSLTTLYGLPSQSGIASALVAFHGILYGTTTTGGAAQRGTIFSVDPASGAAQTVFEFAGHDGGAPTGLIASHNALYGTASTNGGENKGTIFRFTPSNLHLKVEYAFSKTGGDGETPVDGLAPYNGELYGVAHDGGAGGRGAVFAFDPVLEKESVVYSFSTSDNVIPFSTPVAVNGMLYGLAAIDKVNGGNVVYAIDPSPGSFTIVHQFSPLEGQVTDTTAPLGPLAFVGGQLYGTVEYGSYGGLGNIFAVDPATGTAKTLHAFAGKPDAGVNGLIKVGDFLYGTAYGGGANGLGSIFRLHPGKPGLTTLYSFSGNDGAHPMGNLLNIGGTFYGVTMNGGLNDSTVISAGTIFSFDPATHALTTLYSFTGKNYVGMPDTTLVQVGNALYGTLSFSNAIFKLDLTTQKETIVSGGNYGGVTMSGLTAVNGLLYGESWSGGGTGNGSLYQFDPASGALTTLYGFQGTTDGENPYYGLTYLNGALFGTTDPQKAGARAKNFKLDLASSTFTTLRALPSKSLIGTGFTPAGTKLAGIFSDCKTSESSLVLTNPGSGAMTTLVQLASGATFVSPTPGAPVLYTNRTFYGAIPSSGTSHDATIFAYKQ